MNSVGENVPTVSEPAPLPKGGWPVSALDVRIAAGFPSPADDHSGKRIDVLEHLVKHPQATYQMHVRGESMREAGIFDGDVVLVDRAISPGRVRSLWPWWMESSRLSSFGSGQGA